MKQREKRELTIDFSGVGITWLLFLLGLLALGSCNLVRPAPMDPILATSPALQLDSLGEPVVQYRRPNYARSMPWTRGDAGAVADLLPAGSKVKKYKPRITIHTAPTTTVRGGSTAVVGNDNAVADNSKAKAPAATGAVATAADNNKGRGNATGPAASAEVPPDTGTAWWVYLLLVVVGIVLGVVGFAIWLTHNFRPFG